MFCVMCRDATLLDNSPPRFGGIYEMYANSTADPAFWAERWELYKVLRILCANCYRDCAVHIGITSAAR